MLRDGVGDSTLTRGRRQRAAPRDKPDLVKPLSSPLLISLLYKQPLLPTRDFATNDKGKDRVSVFYHDTAPRSLPTDTTPRRAESNALATRIL